MIGLALYLNQAPDKDDSTIHADKSPSPEITISPQPTNTPDITITPDVTCTPTPDVTVTPPDDLPVPETLQELIDEHRTNNTESNLNFLITTFFGIDDRIVDYYAIIKDDYRLENFIGEPFVEDFQVPIPNLYQTPRDYYYLKDTKNVNYLIEKTTSGAYWLWEFHTLYTYDIKNGTYIRYTYNDVLKSIYNVHSADDIVSITTTPSTSNNTDLGKQIQQEVGTATYTKPDDIQKIYDILAKVVYLGSYKDNSITYDQSRFHYSFSTEAKNKLISGESTYGTRVLSIEFSNGTILDNLSYDALSGTFFEGGYVYTVPLEEEDVYVLNEILGIQ